MRLGKRERMAHKQATAERMAVRARANAVSDDRIHTSLNKSLILPAGNGHFNHTGWSERHARQIARWGTTNRG